MRYHRDRGILVPRETNLADLVSIDVRQVVLGTGTGVGPLRMKWGNYSCHNASLIFSNFGNYETDRI